MAGAEREAIRLDVGIRGRVEMPVTRPTLATQSGIAMNLEDVEKTHIFTQAAIAATRRIAQ
jgi:hypothetical protein